MEGRAAAVQTAGSHRVLLFGGGGVMVAWPVKADADTLVRVSHLATHMEGHLAELDINPLMGLPSGPGVRAADALVLFRGR